MSEFVDLEHHLLQEGEVEVQRQLQRHIEQLPIQDQRLHHLQLLEACGHLIFSVWPRLLHVVEHFLVYSIELWEALN